MDLTMYVETRPDHSVLTLSGEIDFYTAPALHSQITDLVESGQRHLLIDLAGVDFMDSTGLSALIAGRNRVVAADGTLALARVPHRIGRLLSITGLDGVFPVQIDDGPAR